nr:MAG TPA: hypothetical protein [Bacteriophage sp.]
MNNDLISREALLEAIRTDVAPLTLSMVFRHIHSAPAVDAVEVMRCKDCELWNEWDRAGHESLNNLSCSCAYFSGEDGYTVCTAPNDFCSYGERRENNG